MHPAFRLLPLVAFLLLAVRPAGAQVTTTFDADLEGWTILGDNSSSWLPATGNPPGCLSVDDLATGQLNLAAAPASYLGDWSALDSLDTLSFDVYFIQTGGSLLSPGWMFRLTGPGGEATALPGYSVPQNVWHTVAVSLDPADWTIVSGTWEAILADVTELTLYAEYVNGTEEVYLDNIHLSGTPVVVFHPCVTSTWDAGSEGWSFSGASSSVPGSGGNPGGYLRVTDSSSSGGHVLAPARYLGDWSSLDGVGVVSFDLHRYTASASVQDQPSFLRLSGPGGEAHVSLAGADLPVSTLTWKPFAFPVDSTTWTLDSGTWSGLLANVVELRLATDFATGSSIWGIDNFTRGIGCPPAIPPVTVERDGVTACASISIQGGSGLARNPADGLVHVLVRDQGTALDGVYPVMGDEPGARLQAYSQPAGLLFDDDGDGYVSLDFPGTVQRFVGADSTQTWVSGFHSGDDDPFGMAFAPAGFAGAAVSPGDIVVCDRGNSGADEIWTFSPDTPENEMLLVGDPGSVDWFDIAAGYDGRLWVVDALDADSLYALEPDGTLHGLALSTPIGGMRAIVADLADSCFYVSGYTTQTVYRVGANGSVDAVASGFTGLALTGLEFDASSRTLWVMDRGAARLTGLCFPAVTAVGDDRTARPGPVLRAGSNPFRSSTRLEFRLEVSAPVRLAVFDPRGREVRRVLDGMLPAGPHQASWDGRGAAGERLAAGVYYVRLAVPGGATTVPVVLLR